MLLIIAIWLGITIIPIGLIYSLFRNFLDILNLGNKIAYLIDILGNVACAELLNDILLKKKLNYLFGKPTETISEVLGKNLFINNLTATGLQLVNLINLHDYRHFEKVLGMYYPKETKLEKRKRIFKLIIFYLIFSLVILFIYKNNTIWTN